MSGARNSSLIGSKIPSPCINICNGPLTNTEEGVCTGCHRTIAECEEWPRASDWRRVEILDNCKMRKMDNYRFTWFDTSSLCETQKVYTGSKQDCVEQFKKDNPSVKLSRVVVDKLNKR